LWNALAPIVSDNTVVISFGFTFLHIEAGMIIGGGQAKFNFGIGSLA